MFVCCCAKTRKDGDSTTIGGMESKLRNSQLILLEFIKEESNLRMKEIDTADLMSKIYTVSIKTDIPKKDL